MIQPRFAGSNQKLTGRPGTNSFSQPPEGAKPADTLISDFCLPICKTIHLCCFKPPSLYQFVTAALGKKHELLISVFPGWQHFTPLSQLIETFKCLLWDSTERGPWRLEAGLTQTLPPKILFSLLILFCILLP